MKKQLASLTAALLAAASLAGCGDATSAPISAGVAPSSSSSVSESEPAVELSDTMRWINGTYAILTTANNWKLDLYGGLKPTDVSTQQMKMVLEDSWGVTDRASAEENLDWLLNEGHRLGFRQDAASTGITTAKTEEQLSAILDQYEDDAHIILRVMFDSYQQFGEHAIDAWDYARAVQCLSAYYVAGYYTLEEALDQSLEICKTIQQTYGSWEDFCQSYMYGYQYWSDDDITDPASASYARAKVYEKVKALPNSPYTLAWDTELVKTW